MCVAHCRVAQGTTPSGDVRARFVVDDVTPSPRPAPSPEVAPFRPEPSPHVAVVDRTIRELCAISGNRRCVAARADSGVEVHYYDARCSSDARGTTNASSENERIARKPRLRHPRHRGRIRRRVGRLRLRLRLRGKKSATSPWRAPGARKRVVVYAVPPLLTTRGEATVVFDIAADIILGLAHPARAMTWLGATLVIGTPRGDGGAVRVADGRATPRRRPFSAAAPVSPKRRGERTSARAAPPRSPRSRLGARARAVLPTKPCSDRIRSDRARMKPKTTAARRRRRHAAEGAGGGVGGDERERRRRSRRGRPRTSRSSRAPDGTLLRVWLHGEAEDEDEDDADADRGTASASANAPAVFVLDDASKNGDFFARSEPVALTCASPGAVARARRTREKLARGSGPHRPRAWGQPRAGARDVRRRRAREPRRSGTAENRETRLADRRRPPRRGARGTTTETTRWKTGTPASLFVPGVGEPCSPRAAARSSFTARGQRASVSWPSRSRADSRRRSRSRTRAGGRSPTYV